MLKKVAKMWRKLTECTATARGFYDSRKSELERNESLFYLVCSYRLGKREPGVKTTYFKGITRNKEKSPLRYRTLLIYVK